MISVLEHGQWAWAAVLPGGVSLGWAQVYAVGAKGTRGEQGEQGRAGAKLEKCGCLLGVSWDGRVE